MLIGFHPQADLPPLLTLLNGTQVSTPQAWHARRLELKSLLQEHITGSLPSEVPKILNATVLNATSAESDLRSAVVRVEYQANGTGVGIDLTLFWRTDLAKSPAPAFLTQYNHRGWALAGAQRGFLTVLYPGGDTRDASGDFRAAYPAATFHKILARAFVASRTLDFLTSSTYRALAPLPPVDASRLAISGHSRNGKQSLLAAAFDERFAAVVGSSPGESRLERSLRARSPQRALATWPISAASLLTSPLLLAHGGPRATSARHADRRARPLLVARLQRRDDQLRPAEPRLVGAELGGLLWA